MASLTDEQILDGNFGGQRVDAFTFQLINADRSNPASLNVDESSPPTVQVDTTRASIRTVSGLSVTNPPEVLELVGKRIRPVVELSNGTKKNLGVLMFGTDTRNITSEGDIWTPELFDETFLLDQDLDRSWRIDPGQSVLGFFSALAAEVLDPLGIPSRYEVDDVAATTSLLYPVGSSRNAALIALSALLAALPPFFDNDGVHRLKPPPATTGAPDHIYEAGTTIVDPTITLTNSAYKIPNRYIVVGDDVGGAPIRGVYDLPSSAPNSFALTGRYIPAPIHTVAGVKDEATATQIAYVDALTDRTTYQTATWAALADPRHDAFETAQLLGIRYLETGWDLECFSGGEHRHSGSRIWGAP